MSLSSITPAKACACLRVALRADAMAARVGLAGLEALILVLLARLFGRATATWDIFPDDMDDAAAHPHAILMPAIGRAPHAAVIEAGLVPDWILPGMRNRGMRPAALPTRPRRRNRPVRAPPPRCPENPSRRRAPTHAQIITNCY